MRKLIVTLMLAASVLPAAALEVGDILQLKFEPEIRNQTRACATLEQLPARIR
jgi:hypothetical protein